MSYRMVLNLKKSTNFNGQKYKAIRNITPLHQYFRAPVLLLWKGVPIRCPSYPTRAHTHGGETVRL